MQRLEEYRRDIEDRIRGCLQDLYLLEKGEKRLQSRTGSEPWQDVTKEHIKRLKGTIALYERILAALEQLSRGPEKSGH
jgi:hypothetical protein